jgi:hypothetical protein
MHSHTITLALAVGLAALVPSGALAQPAREPATFAQNLQSPDARDAAQTGQARQNLQSPDARDAAAGRGTYNSPRVVVVKMPRSSSAPPESASAGGLDWADAGIGAGGLLGLGLIGAGGAFVVVHRKRAHHASPVAGL